MHSAALSGRWRGSQWPLSAAECISIYDPDFYQSIDTYIASMEDRDGLVLQRLRDGSTYKILADELGITVNRVQQIASRATRKVMHFIRCGQK